MGVTSVQTIYNGTLFRSRLEARWATFLDAAGIGYRYERTWLETRFGNWLPDFQLDDGRWVEVKGMLTPREHERLLLLAQEVGDDMVTDVVVLGYLPEDDYHWPVQLHTCLGELWAVPWQQSLACPLKVSGPRVPGERVTAELLLEGMLVGQPEWAEEPLSAARSARFG